jgi:hypothetical protein
VCCWFLLNALLACQVKLHLGLTCRLLCFERQGPSMFPFLIIGKKSKQYKKYACRPLLYPTFFLLALYDSYGLISGFCIRYTQQCRFILGKQSSPRKNKTFPFKINLRRKRRATMRKVLCFRFLLTVGCRGGRIHMENSDVNMQRRGAPLISRATHKGLCNQGPIH